MWIKGQNSALSFHAALITDRPEDACNGKSHKCDHRKYPDPDGPSPAQESIEIIGVRPWSAYSVYQDVRHVSDAVEQCRNGCYDSVFERYLLSSYQDEFSHGNNGFEQMEEQIASLIKLREPVQRAEHECDHGECNGNSADGRKFKDSYLIRVLFSNKNKRWTAAMIPQNTLVRTV